MSGSASATTFIYRKVGLVRLTIKYSEHVIVPYRGHDPEWIPRTPTLVGKRASSDA